eukprot:1159334-Pelagomonas_calceolata.AAC.2
MPCQSKARTSNTGMHSLFFPYKPPSFTSSCTSFLYISVSHREHMDESARLCCARACHAGGVPYPCLPWCIYMVHAQARMHLMMSPLGCEHSPTESGHHTAS